MKSGMVTLAVMNGGQIGLYFEGRVGRIADGLNVG